MEQLRTLWNRLSLNASSGDPVNVGGSASRRTIWLLLFGFVFCLAMVALVAVMANPHDREAQVALIIRGGWLIAGVLSLPFVALLIGWVIGSRMPARKISGQFMLYSDADLRMALAARADVARVAPLFEGIGGWKPMQDGSGRYRFYARDQLHRMLGMDQTVAYRLAKDGMSLEIESESDRGDSEVLSYRLSGPAGVITRIDVRFSGRLDSAMTKILARVLGTGHMAKQAAQLEAQRFSKLIGSQVELQMVS